MAGNLSNGDFARIEFTGKRTGGAIFDTTDPKTAKEAGIFNERYKYGPSLVVVGKGMVVKGLDEALAGMNVGESKTVELAPEKAFGLRSPSLIRMVPLAEFKKRDVNPSPGMVIEVDGRPASIKSVTSGRVMVDMNHALAGEKIVYEIKVADRIEGLEGRLKALLDESGLTGAKVKAKEGEVEIEFRGLSGEDTKHLIAKSSFLRTAKELIPELKKVKFEEEFILSGAPEAKA